MLLTRASGLGWLLVIDQISTKFDHLSLLSLTIFSSLLCNVAMEVFDCKFAPSLSGENYRRYFQCQRDTGDNVNVTPETMSTWHRRQCQRDTGDHVNVTPETMSFLSYICNTVSSLVTYSFGHINNKNNNFILGVNASTLVNTDTVRPGGGEKTLRPSRLPPPNHLLSNTLTIQSRDISVRPWNLAEILH